MSRVDSVRIAIEKAQEHGHDPTGSMLASDAFSRRRRATAGARAGVAGLIQPGGSRRDQT